MAAAMVFSSVLGSILGPYMYSSQDISVLGFTASLAGVPGSIIAAIILYKRIVTFKTLTLWVIAGSFLSMFAFQLLFTLIPDVSEAFPYVLGAITINGFLMATITTYAFEYAVELAPNSAESMSSALIMGLSSLLSVAMILGLWAIERRGFKQEAVHIAMATIYMCFLVAFLLQSMITM